MIIYLCTAGNSKTMAAWLPQWGGELVGRIGVLHYEMLPEYRALPAATYIFSDLELLTRQQKRLVACIWERLAAEGPRVRLLNHPLRALGRYEMLAALRERGMLAYEVHRASELPSDLKFPVFVRVANDHRGARTPVLRERTHVEHAIIGLVMRGYDPRDVLVVGHCDVSGGTGVYHKYSAFRVGERVFAKHLLFGPKWGVKRNDRFLDEKYLALERQYVAGNPHEQRVREIFELARIDYGRMDYSLLDGRVQCWEINTNPVVMRPTNEYNGELMPMAQKTAGMLRAAFDAIDVPTPIEQGAQIPLRFDWTSALE